MVSRWNPSSASGKFKWHRLQALGWGVGGEEGWNFKLAHVASGKVLTSECRITVNHWSFTSCYDRSLTKFSSGFNCSGCSIFFFFFFCIQVVNQNSVSVIQIVYSLF